MRVLDVTCAVFAALASCGNDEQIQKFDRFAGPGGSDEEVTCCIAEDGQRLMKTERKTLCTVSSLKRRWHGMSLTPTERCRLYTAVGCIVFATCLGLFYAMGAWNAVSAFMAVRTVEQTPTYIHANANAIVTVTAGAGRFTVLGPTDQAFEDGSRVKLPRGAKLIVEYTPGQRLLRLVSGEVTVTVAKDPRRPLSVQANQMTAIAVGTQFNVALKPTPRVNVSEGKVEVWDGPVGVGIGLKLGRGESYASDPK